MFWRLVPAWHQPRQPHQLPWGLARHRGRWRRCTTVARTVIGDTGGTGIIITAITAIGDTDTITTVTGDHTIATDWTSGAIGTRGLTTGIGETTIKTRPIGNF